ncbi:hypothetical protein [uncultured Thiohalocapsa sp.]|uniref:hypothetical protein n=1 Tax=uncultured Thiohalocapsa sp. TaxID=768990 RepID=UPI0025D7E290|nr:hypothetical protein [uncultured Thiohalocapsa sp.]
MLPDTVELATLQNQLAGLQQTIARLQKGMETPESVPQTPQTRALVSGYRLFGQDFPTRFAKDSFVGLFRHFAELEPAFPERFRVAARGIGRTRRYVGRTPQEVYPSRPKLWSETEPFAPSWVVGTNESDDKKRQLLKLACQVMGLRFGRDVQVWM